MNYKDLSTERLYLRNISSEDRDFIFHLYSDEEVSRYLFEFEPLKNLEEADEIINFYLQKEPRGQHRWVLINKTDGTKIGVCGVHGLKKNQSSMEMGCVLHKEFWGKGYMQEALEKVIAYAKESLGIEEIHASIYVENEKSIKLAENLGFAFIGTRSQRFRGEEYLHKVYALQTETL